MANSIAGIDWSQVTLTRAEVWQSDASYLAGWDGTPASDSDAMTIPQGKLMNFPDGVVVNIRRVQGKDVNIQRMPS